MESLDNQIVVSIVLKQLFTMMHQLMVLKILLESMKRNILI